jgi:hypothetical protein
LDETIHDKKKRQEWRLDPQLDWRKLAEERKRVWVALDPHTDLRRPRLTVLQTLGQEGWEVAGVQLAAISGGGDFGWWTRPSSSLVLKRPLQDSDLD